MFRHLFYVQREHLHASTDQHRVDDDRAVSSDSTAWVVCRHAPLSWGRPIYPASPKSRGFPHPRKHQNTCLEHLFCREEQQQQQRRQEARLGYCCSSHRQQNLQALGCFVGPSPLRTNVFVGLYLSSSLCDAQFIEKNPTALLASGRALHSKRPLLLLLLYTTSRTDLDAHNTAGCDFPRLFLRIGTCDFDT